MELNSLNRPFAFKARSQSETGLLGKTLDHMAAPTRSAKFKPSAGLVQETAGCLSRSSLCRVQVAALSL
jgi:hypothetical protein